MLIRVESPEGVKRIQIQNESLSELYQKIFNEYNIKNENEWSLYADRAKSQHIPNTRNTKASELLVHGDLIYLSQTTVQESTNFKSQTFDEESLDDVDKVLDHMDGLIFRERDEQLCHHGPQGKCINCIPIEPFDQEYLSTRNPPLKYMSFHAYLKKLKSGSDKGKYTNLENISCKIKSGCHEHPPWPKGICNKCQPSTVYLNRQPYRHVDNIMFENGAIVERFLNFWRKSGHQRLGFLYGRYEPYDGIPLGIRAVVSAIYEPPQISSDSEIELNLSDPNQDKVNYISKKLGLKCIGWIFTDLVADETKKGAVKHFRGSSDTFFLSADECITAGYLQNIYRNQNKYSRDGYFGSKFVTVVVTGDQNNQIHFEGYQVSNQCVSLVKDGCIIPTFDAPELAYIKESSNEQFIPDVYFREKDVYNNEVTKIARPLPVEYLIIDLPAAFAKDASYFFNDNSKCIKENFPIENRIEIGEVQDFNTLHNYMKQFPSNNFLEAMNNFHVLIFLITNQTVHFDKSIDSLIDAIITKNAQKANDWSRTPEWLTVELFSQPGGSHQADTWQCSMCTYYNEPTVSTCAMCQTARS